MALSESEAKLKLSVLNSIAIDLDRIDVVTRLTNMGLPQEVITRIEELWEKTKEIGGKVIHIGRVILAEIIKFINENPHLSTGVALGVTIGALTSMIPFIGPLLAPLATVVAAAFGAVAGARTDRGEKIGNGIPGITQERIIVAKKFFEFFANILNTLRE